MKKALCLITVMVCLFFASASFAMTVEEYIKDLQKEAANGDAFAQFDLGNMYYNGLGVKQGYAKAKEWYGKACDNGDQSGCDDYKRLNLQGH